jgi:hypothetical protein
MKQEDKERQILINRLKTVRDPRERDQIIRLLTRMEKYGLGKIEESAEEKRSVPAQAKGPTEAKGPAEAKEQKVPKGVSFMLGYAVPGFFVIFGLIYIANALTHLISDEGDQAAIPQLIMGALFLLFGIMGFLKIRKMRSGTAPYRGGGPEAKRPKMLMRK